MRDTYVPNFVSVSRVVWKVSPFQKIKRKVGCFDKGFGTDGSFEALIPSAPLTVEAAVRRQRQARAEFALLTTNIQFYDLILHITKIW